MKRQFSCLMIILAMLLCVGSGTVQASGVAGRLLESSSAKLLAKGIDEVALKSAAEAMEKAGLKIADEASLEVIARSMMKSSEDVIAKLGLKAGDEAAMKITQDSVVSSLRKIAAEDVGKLDSQVLSKSFSKDFSAMSQVELKASLEAAGKGEGEIGTIMSKMESSKGILGSTKLAATKAGSSAVKSIKGISSKTLSETEQFEKVAAESRLLKGLGTDAEKAADKKLIADLEWKAAGPAGKFGRLLKATAGHATGPLMMAGGTMAAAVLFMIPSIFQSAFLAQQQQNALLQTYIPPTQFGNIVLQLPDSVVNMGNPAQSQFIYYGIPVNHPGEGISAAAKAAYPGVSGPDKKNKISAGVSNAYAKAFSLGATKSIVIPRYNLDATALATLPIFVSYTSQSWSEWAANGIPDAAFTQTMINLNTGYIFFADGTSQGTPAAPLIGPKTNGETVQSFLATKYGQLKNAGSQNSYTQYVDSYSSAKSNTVSSPVANQFNCACLENNSGVLSEDTIKTCSASKVHTCLLTSVLNQLSAGLVINSQGTVMTPDQDLATEIAKGALGQVIPIQGLGNDFDSVLQMFPGAEQDAIANSGVLTINLGSNLSASTPIAIQGAAPDNYSAKGVYVYQCKNTPLAKILKSQSGGSGTVAHNDQITDFIVFLDQDLNQVPMMAPVQNPKSYNFITMGLNPAIKYVSTIVGKVDSSGAFSFLPQLNIQSPAALVAKGLPASFAPLYGLAATNGSLAVNYNQNLSSTIGSISQSLIGHAKLGQQFKDMQSAMLRLLTAGPFGKYKLSPVDVSMQPNIGGVNLMLYTGFNGYPVSQDQMSSNCTDVLIALSAQGKTVTLPSNNVAQYYGLVTDITYSVRADGTIAVDPAGLNNSPFSPSWTIDGSKASQYYWINKLTAMGQGNDPKFAMPQPLIDFVKKSRTAWINWVQATASSGLAKQEFTGITIPGTANVLTIAGQQPLANGLYIYSCSPSPSSATQDYFVLTNSSSPQITDPSLGTISATTAKSSTNMLSIVSGLLYTASGVQVKNNAGVGYSVNAANLLTALNRANPKGFSNDLKAKLNLSSSQSSSVGMSIVYPFQFGGLQLGIYQADLSTGTYLYLNAGGAGASADFQPTDYLVSVDSYTSPTTAGTKLAASTQYMVSLVSGQVYGQAGVVGFMPADQLSSVIGSLAPTWRSGIADQISSLTANFGATQQDQQQQSAAMNAGPVPNSSNVTLSQDAVATIISNINALDYLPAPHDMLKQDPSGVYVLVSPASADGSQFMYTLFDVPNNMTDGNGNPMRVGAAYDGQGNLLHAIQGVQLASMLQQYGVAVDSNGKQYLGVSNSLPIMKLDPADLALRPGVSGKSMIYSNDPNFPSHGIASPIAYQNSQFHIYYNMITQGYYAMQVNGSDVSYIDMAGGSVYNLDGSSRVDANPVAMNANGDASDLFLPYLNPDNYIRCVMKNNGDNNAYDDFINIVSNFQQSADPATNNAAGLNSLVSLDASSTNVTVAQMPFPDTLTAMPDLSVLNQYNVYWDDSNPSSVVTYMVDPASQCQNLEILPINMNSRAVLNPLPADMYSFARLIMKNNAVNSLIFANRFYSSAKSAGTNSYTMTSGGNSVTVSIKVDNKTNVKYVEIVAGGVTYNYQYTFKAFADAQLKNYQNNVWQVQSIADVTGKILLEKYLPVDSSGNLQLSPVSMQNVVNVPSDASAKSTLSSNLGNVMQDSMNNRFVAAVDPSAYPYFAQSGYVNLEDGALFDSTGMTVGYTLYITDLMALLQQLTVKVVRNSSNQAALSYRAPMPAQSSASSYDASAVQDSTPAPTYQSAYKSPQTSVSTPSYQPAQVPASAPTYQPASSSYQSASAPTYQPTYKPTQAPASAPTYQPSSAPSQSPAYGGSSYSPSASIPAISQIVKSAPMAAPTSVPTSASTPAPVALSSNPQIAALQQQDISLANDMRSRQAQLKNETIAHRKQVLQNAILTDSQQIAANNKKIAAIQAGGSARSTLLGRLGSKTSKKKNKKLAM